MPDNKKIRSCRILVVDDNEDAADAMAAVLTAMGHQASFVTSSLDVLEAARKTMPEVFFLDIGMPDVDGWGLSRVLRADTQFKESFIVAITGHGLPSDRVKSREAGFDAHVTKPAEPELLESILRQYLGSSV